MDSQKQTIELQTEDLPSIRDSSKEGSSSRHNLELEGVLLEQRYQHSRERNFSEASDLNSK